MKFSEATKIFRTAEWWDTKVPMMLGVFCFSYIEQPSDIPIFFGHTSLLIIWTVVTASFGFFLNEVYDHEQDIVSGKKNITGSINKASKVLITLTLALASISIWWFHPLRSMLMTAACFQLLLFCIYSIPPFRLKESGWPGVVIDSLYAFVVPLTIAYGAAKSASVDLLHNEIWIMLTGWAFAAGIRNILHHHITDRKADEISGIKNLANIYSVSLVAGVSRIILLIELPLFLAYLFFNEGNSFIKIVLLILYFLFNSSTANRFGLRWNFKRKIVSLNFNFNSLYEVWLLIAGTLLLTMSSKIFLLLLLFEIILFRNEAHYIIVALATLLYYKILRPIIPFIYYKILSPVWYNGVVWAMWLIWKACSLAVNYSIYYFRIYILRQDENTARKVNPVRAILESIAEMKQELPTVIVEKRTARSISEIVCSKEISDENLHVNALWIGDRLSRIELLTIESFIRQGHRFRLWVYGQIRTPLPSGVELMDANAILHESKIFRYRNSNKYGHGKGSVSGFSDIFRYKLLHEHGGWWVDMDVTCLKPLAFETEYFFRSHHDLFLVGNIMKAPKGNKLMKICYEQALHEINEYNTDWLRPIQILNDNVLQMGLSEFVFKDFSNEDNWDEVFPLVKRNKKIPKNYFLIHWMNEEWRSRGIDKNDVRPASSLGKLLLEYGLLVSPRTKFESVKTDTRHLIYIPVYEYFSLKS